MSSPAEVSSLVIQVSSDQVKTAQTNLTGLTQSAGLAEKATDGLKAAFLELVGPLLTIAGAVEGVRKLFDVTEQFQILQTQVKTAVGSLGDAQAAFEALQDLAAKTPFTISEVTNAFTDLLNKGLDPSSKALMAYGNLATALNISLGDVVSAVTGAIQGQFRGLHSLGIEASETVDGLALTFHGTTTTIAKDANALQSYIQAIANNNFASAMTDRTKMLEGVVNDLKKAWDDFFLSISAQGGSDLLAGGFKLATDALRELTGEIASGQLLGYLKAINMAFTGWGASIRETMLEASADASQGFKAMKDDGFDAVTFLSDAFFHFPENVRAAMQAAGATQSVLLQYAAITAVSLVKVYQSAYNAIEQIVSDAMKALKSGTEEQAEAAGNDIVKTVVDLGVAVTKNFASSSVAIDTATDSWEKQVTAILNTRDATIKASDAEITAADKLRAAWNAAQKAKATANSTKDPLAITPTGPAVINTPQDVAEFQALKTKLQLEEDTINASYKHRSQLIANNTKGDATLQLELTNQLNVDTNAAYEKAFADRFNQVKTLQDQINQAIADGDMAQVTALQTQLQVEEDQIAASYAKRKAQILADTKTTQTQKDALITGLETEYAQRTRTLELQKDQTMLKNASDLFTALTDIAADAAGKQSGVYKVMFDVQKAFAIASSIISIETGLAAAAALGFPAGLAAMAEVAAATASIISNITAMQFHDTGGMIPSGKFGFVGENGIEAIQGPAVVTSTRRTADLMGQASKNNTTVQINNYSGAEATVTESQTSDGKVISVLIKQVESGIAKNIQSGSSPVGKTMAGVFGLTRGRA